MKSICFLLICMVLNNFVEAQNKLKFDRRYVESEDKWVVLQAGIADTVYSFGFIYIDSNAGLTLNSEGTFTINKYGRFIPKRDTMYSEKTRLPNNNTKVAVIPSSYFADLGIKEYPDWLAGYKSDTTSVKHLFKWGYMYNGWDMYDKALTYLERAEKTEPDFKGLQTELAFSYNAIHKYDKAITALQRVLKNGAADCYTYKELSYAQQHLDLLKEAENTYQTSLATCANKSMKGEMAYNLCHKYYELKDRIKFTYWKTETEKWITEGDKYSRSLNTMAKELQIN